MAAITRQPFAPLNESRLQTLTSLKNRQNSIPTSSPGKRKASDIVDTDDSENVDPAFFSKRSKGTDCFLSKDSSIKPSSFTLTKSASTSDVSLTITPDAAAVPRPRSYINPKSPASKINISAARSAPLSAPAGRSPTRGKRSGILSSRRRTGGAVRVDPPAFSRSSRSTAPFSLDAALKGTIPSYARRNASSSPSSTSSATSSSLHELGTKTSWDFVIHEDSPEQEMTNLLQHSTCVLDISSDEETESRRQRERAEGKENVPPADDISQTSRPRAARLAAAAGPDDMIVEKERSPLGEMDVKEYYSEGCDETSIFIVPGDEDEAPQQQQLQQIANGELGSASELTLVPEAASPDDPVVEGSTKTAEELMQESAEPAPCAVVLEPMEGTGESFEVWESGSAKDEAETACCC
ncbi:hypothetical protein DL762_010383 [Monosporascus cannonballus]|uniref:Thymidylate kinase n=1 Tax=Monosporascus cannonballus TaxID=155416 RepID=A0ABY0GUS4_9PEZI|nr:hypothetical protein DL762_010383 [Monosporascus cannonballus]